MLWSKLVNDRIETYTDECHGRSQDKSPRILNAHQFGLIKSKPGLEQSQCEEIDHIAVNKAAELPVLERLQQ